MNLKKRLEDLEQHFRGADPIQLLMEDGSVQTIRLKPGEDVCDLYGRVLSNPDCEEAALIKRAVSWVEPSGSKLIELCNALLNSPTGDESLDAVG